MLGQNFFLWQIQVIVSHFIDEFFRRACLGQQFLQNSKGQIAWSEFRVSQAKSQLPRGQWANIVGIRKVKIFSIFFFIFLQKWIMFSLPTDNGIHFLKMNLMRIEPLSKVRCFLKKSSRSILSRK